MGAFASVWCHQKMKADEGNECPWPGSGSGERGFPVHSLSLLSSNAHSSNTQSITAVIKYTVSHSCHQIHTHQIHSQSMLSSNTQSATAVIKYTQIDSEAGPVKTISLHCTIFIWVPERPRLWFFFILQTKDFLTCTALLANNCLAGQGCQVQRPAPAQKPA